MLGAIAGDVIGSRFEARPIKTTNFPLFSQSCRFTDDTVLTIAVADWLMNGGDLVDKFHEYFAAYPHAGFGGSFIFWAGYKRREPYNSWGNGSAMRVSPVAYAAASLAEVLELAQKTAEVTHNHPEGIRGAQATTAAVFLARQGSRKEEIKSYVEDTFGYELGEPLEVIRATYSFDVSCQGSVPQSIVSFLHSTDYESAVRNAISLGGDSDTMACIAGAIAEAHYGGVPERIEEKALAFLDHELSRMVGAFRQRFILV